MLTMSLGVHIIPIVAWSVFTFARWTIIAHHSSHDKYDEYYHSRSKWNRYKLAIGGLCNHMCDWVNSMGGLEVWNVENKKRHQYSQDLNFWSAICHR